MAGALKIIQDRLRSIVSIQKITKSMKMVSVAKYARAERLLRSVRPFGLGNQMFYTFLNVPPEKGEDVLYFAVTSDRGLCGSCHANISKTIARSISDEYKCKVVCLGDKSKSILQYKFGNNIILVVKDIGKKPPTFLDASIVTLGLRGMGFMDKYWILVYNKFKSMISYETTLMSLTTYHRIMDSEKLFPYDEIEPEIVEYYVQFSKVALMFYTMVESSCSEHSARMTAMDTATNNASEMIGKLRLRYNRGRQASITKELIEIISGAAALKEEK